jgi:hypothetical protein
MVPNSSLNWTNAIATFKNKTKSNNYMSVKSALNILRACWIWDLKYESLDRVVNESNVLVVEGILLWIASNQFFRSLSSFAAAAQWVEINSEVELRLLNFGIFSMGHEYFQVDSMPYVYLCCQNFRVLHLFRTLE